MFDQAETLRRLMDEQSQRGEPTPVLKEGGSPSIPRVIAVSGGKGGVGKTLLTANLGLACADLGQRVLLIDGDLGLSNLDVVLNLKTRGSLDNVLAGECRLSDIIVQVSSGLDIIPASSGYLRVPELTRIHKLMLLDQIDELNVQYDLVLIDTAAGVSRTVQYWAASAAEVVIVVTPEPTSLADGYATMKILRETTQETRFGLIVNMAQNQEEALHVYERFSSVSEEFLGVHVSFIGTVPSDNCAKMSVMHRTPLVKSFPFSNAAKGVGQIAAYLQDKSDTANAKGTVQFFWKRMVNYGYSEVTC